MVPQRCAPYVSRAFCRVVWNLASRSSCCAGLVWKYHTHICDARACGKARKKNPGRDETVIC
jgi:hypothetical protein